MITRITRRLAITLVTIGAIVASDSAAVAADGADFDPGLIITDAVFYNSSAMTEAEIGRFLDARGANCAASSVACLKDYRLTTSARTDSWGYCSTYQGANDESAERIIRKAAQACGVNPQVLLALLEKEQSLVSTRTPTARKYQIATGFGCPDSAACDDLYYGFANQVFRAARQYRRYQAAPNNYSHVAGRVNNIRFDTETACGTSPVFIRSQATAGLYNYTPYQPNDAALDNIYGRGDSCSAYGNRNFWRIFTDWFGSTTDVGRRRVPQRDWNGDSYADILGTHTNGILYSYSGTGGSSALQRREIGHGWSTFPILTLTHNFLRTGVPEVLTVDRYGDLYAYPGTGMGGFGKRLQIGHGWQNFTDVVGVAEWGITRVPGVLAITESGSLILYPSNGLGAFASSRVLSTDWDGYDKTIVAGDWDSDGAPDLITRRSSDGTLWLIRGTSSGALLEPTQIGVGWNFIDDILGGADWDQDGNYDLMATTASGDLRLYPGNGSGNFESRAKWGHGWSSLTLTD